MADKPVVLLPEDIQRVVLHEKGRGKFVQLYVNIEQEEIPIFVSRERSIYHAEILSFILDNLQINYEFEIEEFPIEQGSSRNIKVPIKSSDKYRTVGAGRISVNSTEKGGTVMIYKEGFSESYGVGFNREHFERVEEDFPHGLEVRIL